MKNKLIQIYIDSQNKSLAEFFDDLILFLNKYNKYFYRCINQEYFGIIEQFRSKDFVLGTSYTDFSGGFLFEIKELNKGLSIQNIFWQVNSIIDDVSMYMLSEICPSCHYGNMRLASSMDRTKIIKACDECPYAEIKGEYVSDTRYIIAANRIQVASFLNG